VPQANDYQSHRHRLWDFGIKDDLWDEQAAKRDMRFIAGQRVDFCGQEIKYAGESGVSSRATTYM
jgi:hypothetical protein